MPEQATAGYIWIVFPRIPGGKALLHERDFDPAKHTRYEESSASADPNGAPVQTSSPTVEEQRAKFIAEQLAHNAADVIEKVQKAPADALDVLKAMREAEATGKNRKTVLDAIDAQVEKLTTK
jgi:hypothetical protein